MQVPKNKAKGAQDSAATEEAAQRLGNGTWPVLRSLHLGYAVVRRHRGYFAATGGLSMLAGAGFLSIPRGAAPGPEIMAVACAALAGLGHALSIERTQRDLLGEAPRSTGEAALDWCLRLPSLLGVVALVVATVCVIDLVATPMLAVTDGLVALAVADLLVRFVGFPLHEVVAGERNPLKAFARGAGLAGFPLRATAARGVHWLALGAAAWGLGILVAMVGGAYSQLIYSAGLTYGTRDAMQALGAVVLVPIGCLLLLLWVSWVQTSWAAYHLLRKEERE